MDLKDLKSTEEHLKKAQERLSSFSGMSNSLKLSVPVFERIMPPKPEDTNNYKSASTFIKALAESAEEWKRNLPEGHQTAILALLYGGIQIQVHNLSQVSFDGIRIEGTFNGSPSVMLAHQATVQVLCFSEVITEEKPINPIGFIWSGHEIKI